MLQKAGQRFLLCCFLNFLSTISPSMQTIYEPESRLLPTANTTCTENSSTSLSFVTSLSVRGCPVFVHRLGPVKAGRFLLEPTFCITEQAALNNPSAHFDLLTNEFYFSFPVNVTNELLAAEVAPLLSHLSPKSVSFLEVTSIRLSSEPSLAFTNATFLWGPTEFIGHLRLMCNDFACPSLGMNLARDHREAFDSIRLVASMRVTEGCFERAYPVTVSRAPFLPIASLQRPRSSSLRACDDLRLIRVVQLANCTAYVHRRRRNRRKFVIEPLFCPSPNFQLLRDFSIGRHYVRIPAAVEDSAIIAAVWSEMKSLQSKSMSFMKLWDVELHVASALSQWTFDPLRLTVDRKNAELRVYCRSLDSCELLISVLRSEPVNFWKGVQWSAISLLDDNCEFQFEGRRFAFRMNERSTGEVAVRNNVVQNLEALVNRTVTRDGRTFIRVLQRSCKNSNFQRFWTDYVSGFGDEENFWIGLDVMHRLTSPQGTTLRVEILLWNETEWFAEYNGFSVGSASTRYTMTYTSMVPENSNLVFDALASSKGFKFTTRDVDNDGHSTAGYCSASWAGYGGWWYSNCGHTNPNGVYSFAETASTAHSVWYFNEGFKALKEFRMMIRV